MSTVLKVSQKFAKEYNDQNLAMFANLQPEYTKMPLGALGFDLPLGGGIPYGNLITLAGPFASGKTTMASALLKKYQDENPDRTCVYVDVERAFNSQFQASITGLDLSKLMYICPNGLSAEQILDLILELQQTDDIGMIVLDSVPSLIPAEVMESSTEKDLGLRATVAKKLYAFGARMVDLVRQKNNIFCYISQTRTKPVPGVRVPVIDIAGGDAVKYYSSLILVLKKRLWTKGDNVNLTNPEDCDGFRTSFSVFKSRIADVRKAKGFITFRYGKGIDYEFDAIEEARTFGYIKRLSQQKYSLVNLETGEPYKDDKGNVLELRGEPAIKKYFNDNPEFTKEYVNMILNYVKNNSQDTEPLDTTEYTLADEDYEEFAEED